MQTSVPVSTTALPNLLFGKLSRWSRAAILISISCLLLPRGADIKLGSILIDAPRLVLTIFTIIALNKLLSGTVTLHFTLADLFMCLHVGVIALSAVYHGGFGEGLENMIAVVTDMALAYFVARVAVVNRRAYCYYVRIALLIAAITAVFGLFEMFTGYSIIRAAYKIVFPRVPYVHLEVQRLSFYRAYSTFGTDILFGLYCVSVFALAVCHTPGQLKMRPGFYRLCLALCILGVFASLSSAPWMTMAFCLYCLTAGWIMKNISNRWKIFLLGNISVLFLLHIFSNRGVIRLIVDCTLSPITGYVRMGMWECIWALMPKYWPLGWGWTDDWPRAVEWYFFRSVDSFYAVLLLRSGVFAVIFLLAFLGYSWYRLSYYVGQRKIFAGEAQGWVLSTICVFLTAFTVDIFGNLVFATYFLLGAGQTLFHSYEPALHYAKISARKTQGKKLVSVGNKPVIILNSRYAEK